MKTFKKKKKNPFEGMFLHSFSRFDNEQIETLNKILHHVKLEDETLHEGFEDLVKEVNDEIEGRKFNGNWYF